MANISVHSISLSPLRFLSILACAFRTRRFVLLTSTQHPLFKYSTVFDCILSTNNDFAKHSTLSIDTGRVVDVCRICIRPLIPGKIRLVEPLIHVPSITSKLFFFLLRNSLILMGSNDIVIVEEGRLVTVVALIEDCIDCACKLRTEEVHTT